MAHGRVLVTGASGFIGRALVPALLAQGRQCTLLLRQGSVVPPELTENENLTVMRFDGPDSLPDLGLFSDVVHLAGLAHISGSSLSDPEQAFHAANADLTARLAERARDGGAQRFVFLSSLAAITPNARAEAITDDTRETADTPYGRSKAQAEAELERIAGDALVWVALRPPLVVGPDAQGNWTLLQKLAASGLPLPFASARAMRHFVSRDTVCEAILHILAMPVDRIVSGAYNFADPEPLALADVVRELRAGMGKPVRLLPFPAAVIRAAGAAAGLRTKMDGLLGPLNVDGSRFLRNFSFTPSTGIREAIRRSGRDFVQHRSQ